MALYKCGGSNGQIELTQTVKHQNTVESSFTLNQNIANGFLVVSMSKNGSSGNLYTNAKSSSADLSLVAQDFQPYATGNFSRVATSVYTLKGNAGDTITYYGTNDLSLTSGNQNGGFLIYVFKIK